MGLQISGPGTTSSSAGSSAGKQTLWIPVGEIIPRTTNGPSLGLTELSSNKIMRKSLDFDPSTNEYAQFSMRMPDSWDLGEITASILWTAASGSGSVVWKIQGVPFSDHKAMDSALGSARALSDTLHGASEIHQTSESLPIPIISPQEKDFVLFQIYRDASNAGDTLTTDALLLGVEISFNLLASEETPDTPADPFGSSVKLLLPLNTAHGTSDISSSLQTVTNNGSATISTTIADPFGNMTGVLDLNGSSQFLSLASSPDFTYGLDDYTIEMWLRPRVFNGGYAGIWDHGWSGAGSDLIYLNPDGINNMVHYAPNIASSSPRLVLDVWTHLCVCRVSGVIRIFINGTIAAESSSAFDQSTNYPIKIGRYSGGNYFNGYVSNVRFTAGIGRYPAAFTVPTEPFAL